MHLKTRMLTTIWLPLKIKFVLKIRKAMRGEVNGLHCIIMAATRSKTSSDSKLGNFEEDDVQMPLKLVKELLK